MSVPISSTLESPITSETNLQKERKLFNEFFGRLVNAVVNQVFDLQPQRAVQRMQYLIFLFLLTMFLITLTQREYSLRMWAAHLQSMFLYIFNPAYAATYNGNAFVDFFRFMIQAFSDPHTIQYVPIFLAAFFIALQCAAIYLADIFELQNHADPDVAVKIARDFIWEVALTGSDETIRIKEGEISEEHRLSSNYLIGGPGKVVVDLDSVALFEKPDGTPHLIGPTGREPGGRATLDGFERFRQAIDIRDHYVDLRDQDPKAQSVKGRSRDGLPITATDVRLMFSVYRGENPRKTDQFPYPFSKEAIEQIVYKSASRVTPDLPNASVYEFSWIYNMIGLIRGRLGGFMSERKLSDYLASIGIPEFERAKQSEELIAEQVRRLTQQSDDLGKATEIKPPPEFTSRHKVTNLFSEFAQEFTQRAHENGVELHWIGVGTWKTPPEINIVPEKHLEAWKITQQNLRDGSDEAMKKAETDAMLKKLEDLIQSVPLDAYEEITDSEIQSGMYPRKDHKKQDSEKKTGSLMPREEGAAESMDDFLSSLMLLNSLKSRKSSNYYEIDHETAMKFLLLEYRKQLIEAVEFMKARNENVPQKIEQAIKHIDDQSGWQHWVGKR
jgi:Txe/YoeB family toxin of Txe-Axe toxin-antitoxin module